MNPTHRTHPTDAPLEYENSEQISDEIEDTRSRMDETLDELGDRLSPRRIVDDVMDYFTGPSRRSSASHGKSSGTASRISHSAGEFGQNLGRTVRENPVPSVLIGAGLAWLAFGLGQSDDEETPRRRRRRPPRDRFFADDLSEDLSEDDDVYMTEEDYLLESRYPQQESTLSDRELLYPESYDGGSGESDAPSMWDKTKQAAAGAVNSVSDSVSGAASAASDAIGDAASATASGVSAATSSVASAASTAAGASSDAATAAYRGTRRAGRDAYRYGARSSRRAGRGMGRQSQNLSDSISDLAGSASDKYQRASQQYPLAIGVGCMALGMLAGLVAPRTRREDQWMGETSDDLMNDAWEAGEQAVERGQRVASETLDKATESAREEGLTGDSLIQRGKRVVDKVADAAVEALDDEDLTPEKLAGDVKTVSQKTGEKINEEAGKAVADAQSKAADVDADVKKL